MKKIKKISTNIPEDLINKACKLSNLNQTDALVEGLLELIAKYNRKEAIKLKGQININLDLDKIRQRILL